MQLIILLSVSFFGVRSESMRARKIDFGGGYLKVRTLGGGASAVAYEVTKGGNRYALKKAKSRGNVLEPEYKVLKQFNGQPGIPRAYDFFKCKDGTDCLVLELVGPSLSELHKNFKAMNSLPVETIGSIAIQLIERMEAVHKNGFVHGDLFGNNVSPGRGGSRGTLFAIDFGQTTSLRDPNARARSFDAHSIAFTLQNMFRNPVKSANSLFESNTRNGTNRLPHEMWELIKHVENAKSRGDKFLDYTYMRNLMEKMVNVAGAKYTGKINWPTEILRKIP